MRLHLVLVGLVSLFLLAGPVTASDPPTRGHAASVGFVATAVPVALGVGLLAFQDAGLTGPGIVLLGVGTVFGPSVASATLGDHRRAAIGIGLRVASSALLAGAAAWRFSAGWGEHRTGIALSNAAIALSIGGLAYGLVYNFATLQRSEREYQAAAGLGVDPGSGTVMPSLVIRF